MWRDDSARTLSRRNVRAIKNPPERVIFLNLVERVALAELSARLALGLK